MLQKCWVENFSRKKSYNHQILRVINSQYIITFEFWETCENSKRMYTSKFLTFLGFRIVLGLAISLEASYVTSCLDCRSNIRKKLLYDPVIMAVSLPFQQHSNLSKIQSFSYNEHSFDRKYSWTWNRMNHAFYFVNKLENKISIHNI